ncbi:hypothetical protein [uncultured Friedmanniella sp.]|uniref:hypothetical protein n=1 Tax=uncultured Friedmanniella sp. TaxID=335381 RepID=UPI0035CC80D8
MAERALAPTDVEAALEQRATGHHPEADARSLIAGQSWAAVPANVLALQRTAGNRATLTVLREEMPPADGGAPLVVSEVLVPNPDGAAPDTAPGGRGGFVDGGRVETASVGEAEDPRHDHHPHAFVKGGRTGTVAWAGGGGAGARGNQNTGSIQIQVAPVFTATPGPGAGQFSSAITAGTGLLGVTRSWVGVNSGDQGNGFWVSPAAAALINAHEMRHVASTAGIYAANLAPIETRIANAALGQNAGATAASAIAAHKAAIGWEPGILAFQAADTAANAAPGGTIDTSEIAAGWINNKGPGTVGGVAFTQRVVKAGEAAPAP